MPEAASLTRRDVVGGVVAAVVAAGSARAGQSGRMRTVLATGASGGAFFDYGPAMARIVAAHAPVDLEMRVTAGSNENLRLLSADAVPLALVNMGPAYEAWTGSAPFERAMRGLRAVLPMYETPFHVVALKERRIARLGDLAGRRVGTGPEKGPGEVFFRGLAEALGFSAAIVSGSPADNARQLLAGEIDAFWYGAGIPVAAFRDVTEKANATVFGFAPAEAEAFRRRFAYFAPNVIPAGTYRGQTAPIETVAVWNFILASESAAPEIVYQVTKALLDRPADLKAAFPAAAATTSGNAGVNTFLPFHPGAARYYREIGAALPRELLP